MVKVVAVVGSGRGSGKTTTIESLLKELNARGYKAGAIKKIHREDFSIDIPQKDTWRIAEAGAKIVVALAPKEVCVVKRLRGESGFTEAMNLLKGEDLDLILVEGNPPVEVPKIFATRNPRAAEDFIHIHKHKGKVICISSLSSEDFEGKEIPVLHPIKDVKKIADLLEEQ